MIIKRNNGYVTRILGLPHLHPLPIILLRAGCSPGDRNDLSRPALDEDTHASRILEIAKLMEPPINGLQENTVPHEVLACNFWLLATRDDSKYKRDAWFKNKSGFLPVVSKFKRWFSEKNQDKSQNR